MGIELCKWRASFKKQAAKVAPLAAGSAADVRKSAAGDFCQSLKSRPMRPLQDPAAFCRRGKLLPHA
jgi:hypothetical protein